MNSKKRQAFFDYFPDYDDITTWLTTQNEAYPTRTQLIEVGRTVQGNLIRGIRIFDPSGTEKRACVLQASIHAREWITVTTALWIIQELLIKSPDVLKTFDFYIVPVFNVDGYIHTHTTDRLWRKNRQTVSGSTCIGIDLNRNYAYGWGGNDGSSPNPCSETYRGASAMNSPEVSAITNYLRTQIPNGVAYFQDIHAYGAMFMSPWGYTETYPPTGDYQRMYDLMVIARDNIRAVNGNVYAIGSTANTIYISSGGSRDYTYGTLGILPSFGTEIVGNSNIVPVTSIIPLGTEICAGALAVIAELAKQEAKI